MSGTGDSLIDGYAQQAATARQTAAQLRGTSRWFAALRGITFLLLALALAAAWVVDGAAAVSYGASTLIGAIFFAVVVRHDAIDATIVLQQHRADYYEQLVARLSRDWKRLPHARETAPDRGRQESADLDLFGRASVFQLICQAHTPLGRRLCKLWLVERAAPEEIRQRQAAVRALTDQQDLREGMSVEGRMLAGSISDPDQFLKWLRATPWLEQRQWLLWLARLSTGIVLLAVALAFGGVAPPTATGVVILVCLLINVGVSVGYTGFVHDIFNQITTSSGEMQRYCRLFHFMGRIPDSSERLQKIRHIALEDARGAERNIQRLRQIMGLANLRRAGMLGLLYLALQIVVLWDFHVLWCLERWQAANREKAGDWFEALAELEALMSLASLAHDHPDWVFPEVTPEVTQLTAVGLGHPLLANDQRVTNDVTLGPPGTFLLVTGSNMSGKSTLLRSLGVNAVLAHAGGPVCATAWSSPPLEIATSMRVQDSLAEGVSFFLAELQRLKSIVDLADRRTAEGASGVLLFLLDEILQGTNSAERRIAVTRVVAHLAAHRTFGAVSTHDLELADDPQLRAVCRTVHFRESFAIEDGQRRMTFDYRMREGVAPTTNALTLLEMVGLPAE